MLDERLHTPADPSEGEMSNAKRMSASKTARYILHVSAFTLISIVFIRSICPNGGEDAVKIARHTAQDVLQIIASASTI